jgi:hypothetical protein
LVATETAIAPWSLDGFVYFDFNGTTVVPGNVYTVVFSQLTPNPPPIGPGGVPISGVDKDVYGRNGVLGGWLGKPRNTTTGRRIFLRGSQSCSA